MFFLLSIFWFVRTVKVILLYFYLWQIKEYHIGRFREYFKTEKGRQLLINRFVLIKLLILLPFLVVLLMGNEALASIALGFVLFLYIIETGVAFKNIFKKELKSPKLTKKTVFLAPSGLLIVLLIFLAVLVGSENKFVFTFWLLLIDILTPLIASIIVLLFQIPTVIIRKQILKKAGNKRKKFKDLLVIGITGSYGKTSTKEFLYQILSQRFKVLKTDQHQNSEMGISKCILKKLKPVHEIFIVEMGAYNKGGIKLLTDISQPKIGILTGINEQHMALFGSQDNIIKTKYELIENLPKDGMAVFNGDNDYCLELYKKTEVPKKLLYRSQKMFLGVELEADIWAEDIVIKRESIFFRVCTKNGERTDFEINVLGSQNILNILGAVITAQKLGMSLEEISKAVSNTKIDISSMDLIREKQDPYILDASYSANPDGVIADLSYLKTWPTKKMIVMPCLIELGKASAKVHRRIGTKIGEICDLAIITTKDWFDEIKNAAISSGIKEENILFVEKPEEIASKINIFSSPGDVVLLEGKTPEKVINILKK